MPNAFDKVARDLLPRDVADLQAKAFEVSLQHIAPLAARTDESGTWPEHSFKALSQAGFMGMNAPQEVGGKGLGMLALAAVTEAIAESCASSAICFGMHCVATACLAAKASEYHKDTFLRPIAQGKHISTLALSETGTGSHFWISETQIRRDGGEFVIDGQKQFVTNGGHADSYVLSTAAVGKSMTGVFNLIVLDGNRKGIKWPSGWNGFGMKGNSSRGLKLEGVKVPSQNLLGEEGDEMWFVFEIIAPFFLTAMAGTYLGVAQAAFDIALGHIRTRTYTHSGERLVENPVIQTEIAELWMSVQGLRELLYSACAAGDAGKPEALPHILAAKAQAADVSISVCNRAMSLAGGIGYRENGKLGRLLRDARASDVMAPTTNILKQWTGKALLGLPLLEAQ